MELGFIGLGTMGSSMALNVLKAGHHLTVNDINRDAAGAHLEAGAAWADSALEVAEASDVVFTSLPGPPEVEAVALGEHGILSGISPGKVYFDLSTNSPTLVRRLHDAFAARCAHVLDAPVSGGPQGARSGRLAIWVGGNKEVFERCKPVLDAIGDQAFYVGAIGTGSVAKLVHNCTGYILQTAIAETFSMGVKAGVEPLALWQAVRQGALGKAADVRRHVAELPAGALRPAGFCAPAGPQGRVLGRGSGQGIRRAHASRQSDAGGTYRGAESGLGATGFACGHAVAGGTRGG